MAIRASDQITLALMTTPTYVRLYYVLQASGLNAPTSPTTNPPISPWVTVEPTYSPGSTTTLYTVMLTAYGSFGFEYGSVQVSASFEAAKQAYNLAAAAQNTATTADTTANGKSINIRSASVASNPGSYKAGDQWWQFLGSQIIGMWIHDGSSWLTQTLTSAVVTNLDAAVITSGIINAALINVDTLTGQTITGGVINGSTITGGIINGGTITGSTMQTSSSNSTKRAVITTAGEVISYAQGTVNTVAFTKLNSGALEFYNAGGAMPLLTLDMYGLDFSSNAGAVLLGSSGGTLTLDGGYAGLSGAATLNIGGDGVGGRIWSLDIYNRIYGGVSSPTTGNRVMVVTNAGTLGASDEGYLGDSGWINCSRVNSWAAVTGLTPQYRKLNGVVYLRGRATGGTTNTVFTLPSGYRPGTADIVALVQNGATAGSATRVVVDAGTGAVSALSGSQPNFEMCFPSN